MNVKEEYWPRDRWGFQIGFFLMRFATVEETLTQLKVALDTIQARIKEASTPLKSEPPKSWYEMRAEDQAQKLIRLLEVLPLDNYKSSTSKQSIIDLLLKVDSLNDTRNTLAHGTFAMLDGCTPYTPNYCIFSRAQTNEQNEIVAESKVLHSNDMASQLSEATDVEMGLSSYARELVLVLQPEPSPKIYELTFDARASEASLSFMVGRFMVHMGEIENLIHLVFQTVLDPIYGQEFNSPTIKLNGYWDSLTLAKQVQNLLERLPNTFEFSRLREVIYELQESNLVNHRNLLSHAKVCHRLSVNSEKLQLVAARRTRKTLEIMTVKEVKETIALASKLSDTLSEALAITRMALMKPVKLGQRLLSDAETNCQQ
jgi:hypothetical protein